MADTPTAVTRTASPLQPDPLRGIFYAAGGALADIVVLLVLRSLFTGSNSVLGPLLVPVSLLIGASVGIVCWLGAELGHAPWQQAGRVLAGAGRHATRFALRVLAISIALGVVAALQPTSAAAFISALVLTEAAVVALFHGYFTGMRAEPGMAVGALMALVFGVLGGLLFGLGAGVTYALTYQPPRCAGGCTVVVGPVFGAVFLVIYGGVLGLALGFGMSVASACGLLMRPFTEDRPVRR
jgi:hypothetical protein